MSVLPELARKGYMVPMHNHLSSFGIEMHQARSHCVSLENLFVIKIFHVVLDSSCIQVSQVNQYLP